MKKTKQELEAYAAIRKQLEEEFYLLSLLEKGVVLGEHEALYTENYDLFQEIAEKYKPDGDTYWKNQVDWSVDKVFPERYRRQKVMVDECFVPYLSKEQKVGDLACANGDWTRYVAKYVAQVDGFEYSPSMVETAKRKAEELGVDNVNFCQADACQLELDSTYDNFMMMGLLTYIQNKGDVKKIVQNVSKVVKPGGRLIVKDTLNVAGEDVIYLYNKISKYQGTYWSKDKYKEWFERAGFTLEYETILALVFKKTFRPPKENTFLYEEPLNRGIFMPLDKSKVPK